MILEFLFTHIRVRYSALLQIKESEHVRGIAIMRHTTIMILAVNPFYWREGYGKALVDHLKHVCPHLSCGSHPSNKQAWAFWTSQGFRIDASNFQQDSSKRNDSRLLTQTWNVNTPPDLRTYNSKELLFWALICALWAILATVAFTWFCR
jgi:ribosomal protein S18 acetylase RimI-like enzyme